MHLWLGSDESSTIERLSLVDGNNFGDHELFRVAEFISLPAPESEEMDIVGTMDDSTTKEILHTLHRAVGSLHLPLVEA